MVHACSVVYNPVSPWSVAWQALLSMRLPRQEHWSGLHFPSPGDPPSPGIYSCLLCLLRRQMDSSLLCHLESPTMTYFSPVPSFGHVRPCDPWTAVRQASLSITNSRSLLKLTSIESVMPSSHLILCRPLLLPPSIFPSIRVFSSESAQVAKVLEFQPQHQSFQWTLRTDLL